MQGGGGDLPVEAQTKNVFKHFFLEKEDFRFEYIACFYHII